MGEPLLAQSSPGILLIGAAIFAILFTLILTTLRRAEAFPRGANVTLAVCASLLAVIGIMWVFGGQGRASDGSSNAYRLDFLLLPYTAMAIAMLLVLLLVLIGRVILRAQETRRGIRPRCPAEYEGRNTAEESSGGG